MQSEHVSDPAEPGLRSAERGGSSLFQKGGPNQYACHAPAPRRVVDCHTQQNYVS
jgi:hypothetical protein